MPSNLEWAKFYLERLKWSIIPIEPTGKKPLIKWKDYQKRLPTVEELERWWSETPEANLGLVTGEISGISVVDIDEYKTRGTLEYMQMLYYQIRADSHFRPWDDCFSAKTARGGYHWFFKFNPKLISRQAIPAVDIKSTGGYVVLPPSKIRDGSYSWIRKPWDSQRKEPRSTIECPEMWVDIFCQNPTRSFGEGVICQPNDITNDSDDDDANLDWKGDSTQCNNSGITENNGSVTDSVTDSVTNRYKALQSVTELNFANRIIGFGEGRRDESLFHIANCLFRGGMAKHNVEHVINQLGRLVCDPPFADAGAKFASALTRDEDRERPLKEEIIDWIAVQTGTFSYGEIDRDLKIHSKNDKRYRRKIIYDLKKDGYIEQANGKAGVFRRVVDEMEEIDFRSVHKDDRYHDFKWPLGLEELYMLMPKNIVIVSGAPDAGKTAFMLGVAEMNMDNFPVNYFSSEMGNLEFRSRLDLFPNRNIEDWNFTAFERDANFADVIRPNEVNIIDYLEMHDNFYQIGGHIKDIFNKLNKGVAIIAIQKNPGVDNPLGGNRAREKARLVVNLDRVKYTQDMWGNELKITKCKNWATPHVSPVGMIHNFTLTNGCIFTPQGGWRREE